MKSLGFQNVPLKGRVYGIAKRKESFVTRLSVQGIEVDQWDLG